MLFEIAYKDYSGKLFEDYFQVDRKISLEDAKELYAEAFLDDDDHVVSIKEAVSD